MSGAVLSVESDLGPAESRMASGQERSKAQAEPPKRAVCDHCRRRRVRCDGRSPCQQCKNASLTCRRDHVPRKRGPKRGHGRVIDALRASEAVERQQHPQHPQQRGSRESSVDMDWLTGSEQDPASMPSSPPEISWQRVASDPRHAPEPRSAWTSTAARHTARGYYLPLVPRCVELYYAHIYPIMPLLYMPAVREMLAPVMARGGGVGATDMLAPSDRNLLYALCGLTCLHMSGKNIPAEGGPAHGSWEDAGRFFLDECVANRQTYDFLEDTSLAAVISSFWLSTSFFEINQSRKSWLYLREALTLALEMRLDDEASYTQLTARDRLCRQRVFWILFVTERSFAILRNKPITFRKTPALPSSRHHYETPDIHAGFLQLVSSYVPLDESFVTAWNDGSDPRVSAMTYLALQDRLSIMPSFMTYPSRATTPSAPNSPQASIQSPSFPLASTFEPPPTLSTENPISEDDGSSSSSSGSSANPDTPPPEPTAIQKADLLITQQWLRLIVWQSSFRQGLLSWATPHASMHFAFPLAIARRTAAVLAALPPSAVEVHGMGIFEKIFEIGTWCINVLGACDGAAGAATAAAADAWGGSVLAGMDFAAGDDLGVLGLARRTAPVDPLAFFVRTLSASPLSRERFAERLLLFAGQRPGGMRMALAPTLPVPVFVEGEPVSSLWPSSATTDMTGVGSGSVLREVQDQEEGDPAAQLASESLLDGLLVSPGGSAGDSGIGDVDIALLGPGITDELLDPVSSVEATPVICTTVPQWTSDGLLAAQNAADGMSAEMYSFSGGAGRGGDFTIPRSKVDLPVGSLATAPATSAHELVTELGPAVAGPDETDGILNGGASISPDEGPIWGPQESVSAFWDAY